MRQTCNAKGVFAINYCLMNHNYRTATFAVATGPIRIENISLSLYCQALAFISFVNALFTQ